MYELSDQLRDFKPSDDLWSGDLLKPTDDEISVVLKFYSGIYFKWGYPSKEFYKKSLSFLAIVDICERYDIDLKIISLPMIDMMMDEMK